MLNAVRLAQRKTIGVNHEDVQKLQWDYQTVASKITGKPVGVEGLSPGAVRLFSWLQSAEFIQLGLKVEILTSLEQPHDSLALVFGRAVEDKDSTSAD